LRNIVNVSLETINTNLHIALPLRMLNVMGEPADSKSEQQTQTKQIISTRLQKMYGGNHGMYM